MSHYRLGTLAGGAAGMTPVDLLFESQAEPYPTTYLEFTETVGQDSLGRPIEMGLPRAAWHWEWLGQNDIEQLLTICAGASASVYVRTRKNTGLKYDWVTFTATMLRPQIGEMIQPVDGAPSIGLRRGPVDVTFIDLEVV